MVVGRVYPPRPEFATRLFLASIWPQSQMLRLFRVKTKRPLFYRLCTREIYRLFAFLFLVLLRWVLVLLCAVCRLPLVARAGTGGGRWTRLTFPSCLSPPQLLSEGLIRFDGDGVSSRLRFNCLDCVGGVWTVGLGSKPQATL